MRLQGRTTRFGKRLDQMFQHGAKTLTNSHAVGAVMTELGRTKPHEIFPRRGGEDQPYRTGRIGLRSVEKSLHSDTAQKAVNLIESEYRGRRIINSRRERF